MPTDAQNRATAKYKKKHYKQVNLQMKIADFERLKSFCDTNGESVNGFIKKAIADRLDRLDRPADPADAGADPRDQSE